MSTHWKKVFNVSDIPSGEGRMVTLGDRQVAVFHLENGRFEAMDNVCPHRGASLVDGDVNGTIVVCPWHGWEFDVLTGKSPINPAACVKKFECKVENGEVFILTGPLYV